MRRMRQSSFLSFVSSVVDSFHPLPHLSTQSRMGRQQNAGSDPVSFRSHDECVHGVHLSSFLSAARRAIRRFSASSNENQAIQKGVSSLWSTASVVAAPGFGRRASNHGSGCVVSSSRRAPLPTDAREECAGARARARRPLLAPADAHGPVVHPPRRNSLFVVRSRSLLPLRIEISSPQGLDQNLVSIGRFVPFGRAPYSGSDRPGLLSRGTNRCERSDGKGARAVGRGTTRVRARRTTTWTSQQETRGGGAKGRNPRDAKVAEGSKRVVEDRSDDEDGHEARTDGAHA